MSVDFTLSDSAEKEDRPLYDCHGGAILDIDGDGHLDLYIANGAGKGIGEGMRYASVLFWGSETKEDYDWSIAGGANVAWDSNLENHGGNGRGRSAYFADFNFDGLLDVVLVNIERLDGIHATSQIFYNQGDRNFVPDDFFSEYIQVIIYANSVRAKHRNARNIIIQRSHCKLKSFFCDNHVEASWAIYAYDRKKGQMMKTYDTINPIPGINSVKSMQMADLNRDGVMDLFLFAPKSGIHLFYSTKTTSAIYTMIEEGINSSEDMFKNNGDEISLAVMDDFNLDGKMDIAAIFFSTEKKRLTTVFYSKPMFKNKFQKKSRKKDFPLLNTTELNTVGEDYVISHDIASVDYNSDGFKDIVFTTKTQIYYLTSMMASSKYGQNDFLAVVLEGNGEVNKYGIGSSLQLKVRNKSTTKVHYFYKSINSFSHGTTNNGGAADHRVFFGLGKLYKPIELSIMW
eukprot:CAMPEP_0194347248 /NCGR_PEP_ID=MMETSP0171-20130528/105880_1 /TAXON_ID=218684 /ORGANISM="Corethron pennatum, Strain L29A3" /LENGTH=456 /DNA_ID=CAMNT_0039114469 /DNA_START=766 /DNA_END=2133 /DNA_ORIENTATION=+